MLQKARQQEYVKVTIERYEDTPQLVQKTFQMKPVLPITPTVMDGENGMTIESLGINILVTRTVKEVTSGNNLQAGDKIVSAQFELNERQAALPSHARYDEVFDFKKLEFMFPAVFAASQSVEAGTKLKLKVERGNKIVDTSATVSVSDEYFMETRGFVPGYAQEFYQDKTAWAAIKNGFRQTVDDASRVLKFLKKLVNGQLSVTNFGGPGTIAVVATSEASQGTSRLLLFLTLLSANLAIINFLPIPVLDGGHMVFLAYEGIFRRPVGERIQYALTLVGFLLLLALMVTVIGMDIWRLT